MIDTPSEHKNKVPGRYVRPVLERFLLGFGKEFRCFGIKCSFFPLGVEPGRCLKVRDTVFRVPYSRTLVKRQSSDQHLWGFSLRHSDIQTQYCWLLVVVIGFFGIGSWI